MNMGITKKAKRVKKNAFPLTLTDENKAALKRYKVATGVSMNFAINRAIEEFVSSALQQNGQHAISV